MSTDELVGVSLRRARKMTIMLGLFFWLNDSALKNLNVRAMGRTAARSRYSMAKMQKWFSPYRSSGRSCGIDGCENGYVNVRL